MADPATTLASVPGVSPRDAATRGFVFNHTMLRVKDARASLDFYTRVLGFSLVRQSDFPEAGFSLYFLAIVDPADIPADDAARKAWVAGLQGVLELTHNHGTESQDGPVYHDGNSEPRGFGHICITVPDVRAACERFEALGVPFQKRLTDGRMKEIAFIKDPDGYWVEIIQPTPLADA
ncbi:MAG TPA: lactoylglutathione lyase [Luteimonas sp.]